MAKGYWIASVDVSDRDVYQEYIAANAKAFRKYNARFLVRGGAADRPEGKFRARIVVIEFPDYATALECYRSREYADALAIRQRASESDVAILDGYDGLQPGDG